MTGLVRRAAIVLAGAAVALVAPANSTRAAETVQPQTGLVNDDLAKAWKTAELKPSKKATDYEFVRRAFIDIVGRIPTAEEVRDYAENPVSLAYREYYGSREHRTCKACGHVMPAPDDRSFEQANPVQQAR